MNRFFRRPRDNRWWASVGQVLTHILIAVLAFAIAFSLPAGAQFILYRWWPSVSEDANLLIASEIALAAVLVLLANLSRIAWENRYKVRIADAAALVYAREKRDPLTRWRERRLVKRLPAARDAYILTVTGFDTFAGAASLLHEPLKKAYEIRVMLLHPGARSAERRVKSLPREVTLQTYAEEVHTSIAYLAALRTQGKKVTLKFYEHDPFWKVAVLGDHVWVQYCHSGREVKGEPEYVFALDRDNQRRGFFVPFYMYFLEQWIDQRHPAYDFDTRELVYRDELGRVTRRARFGAEHDGVDAALLSRRLSGFDHWEGNTRETRSLVPSVS